MTQAEMYYALGELTALMIGKPKYRDALICAGNTITQQNKRIAEALAFCEDREDIIDGESGPRPTVRKYLQFDSQRAVSWHEIQDCCDAIRRLAQLKE